MEITLRILMDAFFIALLVWCACTDIKTRTVSNLSVALLLGLGLAHMAYVLLIGSTWWQYPAGLLFAVPFFIAWMKNSMGAGDVKLIMGIGLYLGVPGMFVAFVLMLPVLAVLSACSWIRNRTLRCHIPFAPVLALGAGSAAVLGYFF